MCSFIVLNGRTGILRLVEVRGRPLPSRSSMELGDHLVGAIVRAGVGEIINDVAADPRPFHGDSALCSVICCPLKSKSRVVGAVVVGSESMRHYTAADLQLLNALASQAAATVELARLYGALTRPSAQPEIGLA